MLLRKKASKGRSLRVLLDNGGEGVRYTESAKRGLWLQGKRSFKFDGVWGRRTLKALEVLRRCYARGLESKEICVVFELSPLLESV